MFNPVYSEKHNILIYWLNKLQNTNMGFLLSF